MDWRMESMSDRVWDFVSVIKVEWVFIRWIKSPASWAIRSWSEGERPLGSGSGIWRPSGSDDAGLCSLFGAGWNSSVGLGGALLCGTNDSEETIREEKAENCEDLSCRGKEMVGVGGGFRLRRQQGIQPIVTAVIMIPSISWKEEDFGCILIDEECS
jgi:hypothetical protein